MIYGYARVSTKTQNRDGNSLEDQRKALTAYGCTEIVEEAFTGKTMDRPAFARLFDRLQEGDTLVVTKLDRFARTAVQGVQAIRELFGRGVKVHILNMGLIENTLTGNLILTVMLAFAEYERGIIVERTRTGKAIAKENNPDFKDGRHSKEIDAKTLRGLYKSYLNGDRTVADCCKELGVSRSTWYNKIKQIA